jgi:hypothetical protein
MHRRTLLIPLVFALALGACSSTRTYTVEDLGRLVLQRDEAPRGTSLDASSSGLEDLDELAEDDEVKKRGLQEAGFIRGRFQLFITDETVGEGSKGVLASSFALLFETADGAHRGMSVFKDAIERDGTDLRELGPPGAGEEGFTLVGKLQPGLPPGYAFLWRHSNVILGLIAAGDIAGLNENAARDLVQVMDRHAR